MYFSSGSEFLWGSKCPCFGKCLERCDRDYSDPPLDVVTELKEWHVAAQSKDYISQLPLKVIVAMRQVWPMRCKYNICCSFWEYSSGDTWLMSYVLQCSILLLAASIIQISLLRNKARP